MSRICVLGNSHAAAVALGWKAVQERYGTTSLTFFALPRDRLADLHVEGRALVPATAKLAAELSRVSGGPSSVNADVYDAFWLCGLGLGVRASYALLNRYWAEFEQPDHQRTPISNFCLSTAVASTLKSTLAYRLATNLKQITDRPIIIMPVAMWSEAVLANEDEKYNVVHRAVRDDKERAIWDVMQRAYAMLADEQVRIAPQPAVTLRSPLLTHDRYSRGSVALTTAGLTKEHPEADFAHMNAEFGVEVLTALLN